MAQAILRTAAFAAFGSSSFTQPALEKAQRQAWWTALSGKPLQGKILAVSGANAGIGLEIARAASALGATTLLLCRSAERGRRAADDLRKQQQQQQQDKDEEIFGPLEVEEVDVSSLASIRAFAARFEKSGRPLHCLVNNAGILTPAGAPKGTAPGCGGCEASFATNVLGAAALTLAMKPALLRAAAAGANNNDPAAVPRVIFVASGGMYTSPLLSSAPLDPPAPTTFDGTLAYARDKRRQVALAEALGRRWSQEGVLVASYHPGWADTPGVQTSLPAFRKMVLKKLRSPAGGADTAVWMSCAPADLSRAATAAAPPPPSSPSSSVRPGEFYLDRQAQPKHVLGWGGRVAGTAYSDADADALLENVVAMLREVDGGGEGGSAGGAGGREWAV